MAVTLLLAGEPRLLEINFDIGTGGCSVMEHLGVMGGCCVVVVGEWRVQLDSCGRDESIHVKIKIRISQVASNVACVRQL